MELKNKLEDDKAAREIITPTPTLQAERLGINKMTPKYFGMVLFGAIGGDGSVSVAIEALVGRF